MTEANTNDVKKDALFKSEREWCDLHRYIVIYDDEIIFERMILNYRFRVLLKKNLHRNGHSLEEGKVATAERETSENIQKTILR